jgi:hypothetical protein
VKRHWWNDLETPYRYTHFAAGAPHAQALRLARGARQCFHTLRGGSRAAV